MQLTTNQPALNAPFSDNMLNSTPMAPPATPPRLGPSIPGTVGGLPAVSGLSVYNNPLADALRSNGRGQDTELVHMTPGEVQSLRGLAQLTGGDLTRNPTTGLPEAGWLGNLLPTIFGVLGSMVGIPTWLLGLGGVAGGTAATGSLGKGLMMGLQTFGGAGLGNAVGLGGKLGNIMGGAANATNAATGALGATTPLTSAATPLATSTVNGVTAVGNPLLSGTSASTLGNITAGGSAALNPVLAPTTLGNITAAGSPSFAGLGQVANPSLIGAGITPAAFNPPPGPTGFLNKFTQATTIPGLGKIGPAAAGLGLLTGVSSAFEPSGSKTPDTTEKTHFPYKGPYTIAPRRAVFPGADRSPTDSSEWNYFPDPIQYLDKDGNQFTPGTPTKDLVPMYAAGGPVNLKHGAFVVDARTVSELGNGSSGAGQDILSRYGGTPIKGPGDGVSDSIPAQMPGGQPARVARDEVHFSPEAVARIGGGNPQRGAQRLYGLMNAASKARKGAGRGKDTGLRRGLA